MGEGCTRNNTLTFVVLDSAAFLYFILRLLLPCVGLPYVSCLAFSCITLCCKTTPLAISPQLFLSKLKTLLFNNSYHDSSSSLYLPPRLNSKHHPPHPSDCLPG